MKDSTKSRIALIVTLIVAGEMIFGLPFHLARYFRPTLLTVFDLDFTELGVLFAHYGAAAMIAYYPGGAIADRFSARNLMIVSLLATAAGGFYMATYPGYESLKFVYLFWGVSTVFLFWGALIRATREWGGRNEQGVAFGVLEGGRGLMAFAVAFIAVRVLGGMMPEDAALATSEERQAAFRTVILIYSSMPVLAALLVWKFVPVQDETSISRHNPLQGMWIVLQRPVVWAQAIIIICAYCSFKGSDNYSAYAEQVLGMNEVEAARFATWGAFLRPIGAVAAGLIADRFDAAKSIGVFFAILVLTFGPLALIAPDGALLYIYFNVFVSYFAVFALRGIYFALLEENSTPVRYTGAAVGLVSLVGYTPDFFFGLITGPILDANPGAVGFGHYFLLLAGIMTAGVCAVLWLLWLRRKGTEALWPKAAVEIKA